MQARDMYAHVIITYAYIHTYMDHFSKGQTYRQTEKLLQKDETDRQTKGRHKFCKRQTNRQTSRLKDRQTAENKLLK